MILHISGDKITMIYDERLDLSNLGPAVIHRASHVEPDSQGRWSADMGPAGGPVLTPFTKRSDALAAEHDWLEKNISTF